MLEMSTLTGENEGRMKGGSVVTIRVNGPKRGNHENITLIEY